MINIRELIEELMKYNTELKIRDVLKFASNITLVLNHERMAYRSDIHDKKANSYLISKVLDIYPSLGIVNPGCDSTSFIFLNARVGELHRILDENIEHDSCSIFGKILGYHYTNTDHSYGDRVFVSYMLTYKHRDVTIQSSLYSFVVPRHSYNDCMKANILNDVNRFNAVLNRHGVNVCVLTHDG